MFQINNIQFLKSFGIGLLAGSFGSLVGLGGGFISLPLLTGTIGLTQLQANATSLAAAAATGVGGSVGYGSSGNVDYKAAVIIATTGVVSANFGVEAAKKLSEKILKRNLGIFMICIAPLIPLRNYLIEWKKGQELINSSKTENIQLQTNHDIWDPKWIGKLGAIGIGSGFLSGMFGVGGGAITVPAIALFTNYDYCACLGVSLAAMIPTTTVGAIKYHQSGLVVVSVAIPLLIGSSIGSYCGSKLGLEIPEDKLRWFFSFVMVFLGSRTLRTALRMK